MLARKNRVKRRSLSKTEKEQYGKDGLATPDWFVYFYPEFSTMILLLGLPYSVLGSTLFLTLFF
jgi:hypothetical protein